MFIKTYCFDLAGPCRSLSCFSYTGVSDSSVSSKSGSVVANMSTSVPSGNTEIQEIVKLQIASHEVPQLKPDKMVVLMASFLYKTFSLQNRLQFFLLAS